MPELPDVEGYRRYIARYARGRQVREVVASVRDLDHHHRRALHQVMRRAIAAHAPGDRRVESH